MVKDDTASEDRRQRWLHPKHLPYLWMIIISLVFMPAVAVGVVGFFLVMRIGRWWQRQRQ